MKNTNIEQELQKIVGIDNLRVNEPMKKHTTFKVGGNAKYLVTPCETKQIIDLVTYLKNNNIKYYILGNGSNILVKDEGIDGVVIKIASGFNNITVNDCEIIAQSGANLVNIARKALNNELGGFEFASGIPGTLGGAIFMNAGAYGKEIKDVLEYANVLDNVGNIIKLTNEELEFGYRKSILSTKEYIVLDAKIKLYKDNKQEIKAYMEELAQKRKEKQPLTFPNAGSTFKRPEGNFAGKLIEDAGLKGFKIGGAQVSEKHAGFIINTGNATATDILELIKYVTAVVEQKYGIILEPEIKII